MKTSQIIFLGVALTAGAAAFLMRGKAPEPAPVVVQAPPAVETDQVLIASRDIPLGTVLADGDVTWQIWPKPAIGPAMLRKSEAATADTDLKGGVVRGSFLQGEPIRRDKVIKGENKSFMAAMLPSGSRAVAINIDAAGSTTAGGFILPNDRVDILRVMKDDGGGSGNPKGGQTDGLLAETILSDVRVLAIGQNIQEKNGERVVVGSNATLELTPDQAKTVILAQRSGQLTLVLRSLLDFNKPAEEERVGEEAVVSPSAIVRYGFVAGVSK